MAMKEIRINWTIVDQMLRSMCDGPDIAARLGVHENALYRVCRREKMMLWEDYAESIYVSTRELLREQQVSRKVGYKREAAKAINMLRDVVLVGYAIYYRLNGQYYTYTSYSNRGKYDALVWFKNMKQHDKIVAIFTIRLK